MLNIELLPKLYEYVEKHKSQILKNGKDFSINFLAQGEYNINYIIENGLKKIILRINTGSQLNLEDQIKYEYNALEFLSSSQVTPKPYYLDESKSEIPFGILTMQYLKGRPLDYKTDLKRAGKILAKIHSLKNFKNYNFISEKKIFSSRLIESKTLLKNVWKSDYISEDIKHILKIFLEINEKNKKDEKYFLDHGNMVLNNTEVNSSNFILGSQDYLIDWEKPVISDCTQDITQFLIPTTTLWKTDIVLSKQEIDSFYKAYSNYIGCSKAKIKTKVELYKPYMYLRALSWCAFAFVEYKNSRKNIVNGDTIKKITEYLQIEQLHKWLSPYGAF